MSKIEATSGNVSIWGAFLTVLGRVAGWIEQNTALCGLLIAFSGLAIQASVAAYNTKIRRKDEARKDAEEARKGAEEKRRIEEHRVRMEILRNELSRATEVANAID